MNIFHFWSQGLKKGIKRSRKRQNCKIWTLSTKFVQSATATGKELFLIRQLLVKRKDLNFCHQYHSWPQGLKSGVKCGQNSQKHENLAKIFFLSIASRSTKKRFLALFWYLTVSKNLYLVNIFHFWSQGLKKGLKRSRKRQNCKIRTLSTKFVRSATATGKELFPIRQLLVKRKNLNWGGDTILGSQPAKKGAFHTSKVEKMLKKKCRPKTAPPRGQGAKNSEFFLTNPLITCRHT